MRSLALVLVVLASGCALATTEVEITEADLEFLGWPRVEVGSLDSPAGVYANPLAASGPPYPLGAVFVKTDEEGPPSAWRVRAMAKRGGRFDAGPMPGWEVLELYVDERGAPRVLWRGAAPPSGLDGYALPDGTVLECVACHRAGDRDSVLSR